jgi:uncharacterized protein YejL (UPF0352 family)
MRESIAVPSWVATAPEKRDAYARAFSKALQAG